MADVKAEDPSVVQTEPSLADRVAALETWQAEVNTNGVPVGYVNPDPEFGKE